MVRRGCIESKGIKFSGPLSSLFSGLVIQDHDVGLVSYLDGLKEEGGKMKTKKKTA